MSKHQIAARAALALSIGLGLSAPAHAVDTTFASVSAASGSNFYFKNAKGNNMSNSASLYTVSSPYSTAPGSTLVDFSFLNLGPSLDNAVSGVAARFKFNADVTGTASIFASGYLLQYVTEGSFSYTTTKLIVIGNEYYAPGSNLLSGQFSYAELAGPKGGVTAGLGASTLTLESAFIDLSSATQEDADFTLKSITPALGQVNSSDALKTFEAEISSAEFSTDPALTANGIPEPATWAMMLVGFGGMGAAMRARRRLAAKA